MILSQICFWDHFHQLIIGQAGKVITGFDILLAQLDQHIRRDTFKVNQRLLDTQFLELSTLADIFFFQPCIGAAL